MHFTQSFLAIIRVFSHVPELSGKNRLEIIYGNSVARERARFFSPKVSSLSLYSLEDLVFGVTDIVLIIIHQWVDYNVVSIVFGALPLTLWLATKRFENFVKKYANRRGKCKWWKYAGQF